MFDFKIFLNYFKISIFNVLFRSIFSIYIVVNLTVEKFGHYGLLISISSFLSIVFDLGIQKQLPLIIYEFKNKYLKIILWRVYFNFIFFSIISIFLLVLFDYKITFFTFFILILNSLFINLANYNFIYLQYINQSYIYSKITIIRTIIYLSFSFIFLHYFNSDPVLLIFSELLSTLIIYFIYFGYNNLISFDKKYAITIFNTEKISLIYGEFNDWILNGGDRVLLSNFIDVTSLGYISFLNTIYSTIRPISVPIKQYLSPSINLLFIEKKKFEKLNDLIKILSKFIYFFALIIIILTIILVFFISFFLKKYIFLIPYLPITLLTIFLSFFYNLFIGYFYVNSRYKKLNIINLLTTIYFLITFYLYIHNKDFIFYILIYLTYNTLFLLYFKIKFAKLLNFGVILNKIFIFTFILLILSILFFNYTSLINTYIYKFENILL